MADNQSQRDEREASLPKWAQELIRSLRLRIQVATEPLVAELARLRPRMELLKARWEAMTELLECAARGGHKTAEEIVRTLESYDLTLTPKEE